MGYNLKSLPKSYVYVIKVDDYTDETQEVHYLLPRSFPSRDEARKCLAAEVHRLLEDKYYGLILVPGYLEEFDNEARLVENDDPDGFRYVSIKIVEIGFYNTFDESIYHPNIKGD